MTRLTLTVTANKRRWRINRTVFAANRLLVTKVMYALEGSTWMKSIFTIVLCIASSCASAQELRNCQTLSCRSFKELLAAKDPLVMNSDLACFYDEKAFLDGGGGSADLFFLLSTESRPAWETFDGSAFVHPNLVSIEITNGQPDQYRFYAPDKHWISGECQYSGDRTNGMRLQPYEESDEVITFATFLDSYFAKNASDGCTVTTIRKSTWRFTYHQESIYPDIPGRCFAIPKQSSGPANSKGSRRALPMPR